MSTRSVTLTVAGQSISLRTDQSDRALQTITSLVNAHVDRVQQSARSIPTNKVFLLAALTLAEELAQARDDRDEYVASVRDCAHEALRILDEEDALG